MSPNAGLSEKHARRVVTESPGAFELRLVVLFHSRETTQFDRVAGNVCHTECHIGLHINRRQA